MIIKQVIEASSVDAKADTVQADRGKIRDGLAALKTTKGLIGTIKRTAEGEADKPFVFAHAQNSQWAVLYDPAM